MLAFALPFWDRLYVSSCLPANRELLLRGPKRV